MNAKRQEMWERQRNRRSNFQTLHPYISVRLVNQASNVPITAAEAETANAKETDRQEESILQYQ